MPEKVVNFLKKLKILWIDCSVSIDLALAHIAKYPAFADICFCYS